MRVLHVIALALLVADCRCQEPALPPVTQTQPPPPSPKTPAAHFPERAKPAEGTLDIYVDGALLKNVPVADETALAPLLPAGPRIVLLHGESVERWLAAPQLAAAKIGKNRRGMVKFFGGGSGEGGGEGGGGGDIRGLEWVEVRTASSPKLPGEPY